MPNLDKIFKDEIRRITRSETKAAVMPLQKSIAKLKEMLRELKRQVPLSVQPASEEALRPGPGPGPAGKITELTPQMIRARRERLGLSMNKFAQVLGVNNNSVFNWEHGKTKPKPAMIAKLLAAGNLDQRETSEILAQGGSVSATRPAARPIEVTPQAIKSIRWNLGVNMNQFARVLGVNYNSVRNWEHGKSKPKPAMVKKLLVAGNLSKSEVEKILAGKQLNLKKTPEPANNQGELTPLAIKSLREDLGLNKSEFAARLGVSYNSVFNWENGETRPSPSTVEAIWAVARPARAE